MDRADYDVFERAFQRLVATYRLKLNPDAIAQLARTYFAVLEEGTIDEVLQAAKQCLGTCRRFPKPATWWQTLMQARPAPDPPRATPVGRTLSAEEARDYLWASAPGFETDPCLCAACQDAGVSFRPLRYVPTETASGELETAWCVALGKLVTVGHYAHGAELARWYAARDAFFAQSKQHGLARIRTRMETMARAEALEARLQEAIRIKMAKADLVDLTDQHKETGS